MKQSPNTTVSSSDNQNKPVAWDKDGRPLYYAPQPQTRAAVHVSRAVEPDKPIISEEMKRRHEDSSRRHPELNLSEAEFIISEVRRHPIGLYIPILTSMLLIVFIVAGLISYPLVADNFDLDMSTFGIVTLLGVGIIFLIGVFTYITAWVYNRNRFYLTNESVIQEIQLSLFSKHEQTVSLSNIEDASFRQNGIIQSMFGYGSIRLSTEGDETTYRFSYVSNPKNQIALLNNAVEAFKNGRPVGSDD